MKRVIGIMNHKGGVAKTTTTNNVGHALARMGKRVCLIDMDPQANLTYMNRYMADFGEITGMDGYQRAEKTVVDSMIDKKPYTYPVRENLDIIVTNISLNNFTHDGVGDRIDSNFVLRNVIDKMDYDYILIDTAPDLGRINNYVTVAASDIICCIKPEIRAINSLRNTESIIESSKILNGNLHISGILITMLKKQTVAHQHIVNEVQQYAKYKELNVFENVIPVLTEAVEAGIEDMDIFSYKPDGEIAKTYIKLAEEIHG